MRYITPADVPVTDDWYDHILRNSFSPGTDYATTYETDCRMPFSGVVVIANNSTNTNGDGRKLRINCDDGRELDMLHAANITASVGQRVTQGQTGIFFSGGSGYGNDHYYDSHVHVTLRERPGLPDGDTIDFELYLKEESNYRLDDDMPMFFDPNTIIWPNGWANAYDPQVYQAIKSYCANPTDPQWAWVKDTYVRESWATVDGLQARQIDAANNSVATFSVKHAVPALVGALIAGLILFSRRN